MNDKLHVDEKMLLLGSIAPDLSKQVGESKEKSHFLPSPKDPSPDILSFLEKYKNDLHHPFLLGYFIHLYTDKLWIEEVLKERLFQNSVRLLDGTIISFQSEELNNLIYNDYSNLNVDLIDYFNLDLSLFYEKFPLPKIEMSEIPVSKLPILIEKMGVIIENSERKKTYVFDAPMIIHFIESAAEKILKAIEEYQIHY